MKKIIILLLLALPLRMVAQSSMTDSQVASYIQQEMKRGTSRSQIVTHLMQNGVDISQIKRVRKAYERAKNDTGLGDVTSSGKQSRLRQANGVGKQGTGDKQADRRATQEADSQREATTSQRIAGKSTWQQQYDEEDSDFKEYQKHIAAFDDDNAADSDEVGQNKKKVFGRDIFSNKNLSFEPLMNIATPQNYVLGAGDQVSVDIYGASQKSVDCTVSPDGDIVIEGYGPIRLGGLTVAAAKAKLRSTLGSRYQSSRINLSLGQTRTVSINVMGEVKKPGTYTLSAFASVFNALYMAGGTNDIGTLRNIKIYRANRLVSVCDIYDYILNGKMTGNVRLHDGDVIIVGPYDCLVNVTGKVKRPMYYEMKRNESLQTLLRYSGGFTGDAYKKAVRVNRKTGREYAVFNVEEFDMSSFHVADGDSVSIDSILPRYSNTVEIKGAVFRPGMYQLGDGINSVRTLVQHAEGLTEDAFTARAVMHRMKEDRTLRVISVDIKGIMDQTVADIPLKENDVLFIPTKQTAMNEQTITIQGEVMYPGIYKYADNETLEDFVLQAGGLTDKASTVKVDVARRVSNPKAKAADSIIAKNFSFALKDGFVVDGEPGFVLQPFDEVFVRKDPSYSAQQNVSVDGEVTFPGTYTLSRRGMRLTDLMAAAGGATNLAYVHGARLERRTNEAERKRMEAALQMQNDLLQQELLSLAASQTSGSALQQVGQQSKDEQLKKFQVPDTYSVGIELDKALANPNSDANIVLREGDRLVLPQYTATVKVNGAVMYPNTVSFINGKGVSYYINASGGYSKNARKSGAYVIYMNGMVSKSSKAKVEPGCEIVVPSKIRRRTSPAEILNIGSSMSSIAAMIATIANMAK